MESRSSASDPSRRRAALALTLGLAAASWAAPPCRADLVIEAPAIAAAPGSSGSFDVLITSTGGTFDVASDTIELTLTGPAGVTFTGVLPQANPPNSYIYVVSATTMGGMFSFDSFPTNQFDVFDTEFGPLGSRAINSGDVFGVVNVAYSVDPGATPAPLAPSRSARILRSRTPSARTSRSRCRMGRSPSPPYPSRRPRSCYSSASRPSRSARQRGGPDVIVGHRTALLQRW